MIGVNIPPGKLMTFLGKNRIIRCALYYSNYRKVCEAQVSGSRHSTTHPFWAFCGKKVTFSYTLHKTVIPSMILMITSRKSVNKHYFVNVGALI